MSRGIVALNEMVYLIYQPWKNTKIGENSFTNVQKGKLVNGFLVYCLTQKKNLLLVKIDNRWMCYNYGNKIQKKK